MIRAAMTSASFYDVLLYIYVGLALVSAPVLFFIDAPYGRHAAQDLRWGPRIRSRLGWILMEAPAPLGFLACFLLGDRRDPVSLVLLLLWQIHYVNRAFVFPLGMRGGDKPMPVVVVLLAFCHNLMNAYLNGRYLYTLGPQRPASWLLSAPFLCGLALFLLGNSINRRADRVLRDLRRPGETGYKIPRGGLFQLVSCPNYLGEIIEWCGWALCTLSPAAAAFVLFTVANLLPRAHAHHRFYRERFPDYPAERRALIPFLF